MNIIYISPGYNNPHLFPIYKETFAANGHTETNNPLNATHCFIETISGSTNYDPERLIIILKRKIPIICFDNREFGQVNKETWKPIDFSPDIYFVRTIMKGFEYPDNVYPYDWHYFPECDFTPASKEELNSRHYDCCYIGVEAPPRTNVINGLKDSKLKVKSIFNDHLTRLPHEQWVNEYRESKLAIECEGGGLTSEKFLQLFAVAPMLRVVNKMQMAFPFTDGINCIEINEHPTEDDIEKVEGILKNKDWLYDIYINGIEHIKKYYSEEALSNYILTTLKVNNII